MPRRVRFSFAILSLLTAVLLLSSPLHAAVAPSAPPFMTNLLANPSADTGNLSGWQILENSGEGWKAQDGMFRTSYFWNRRQQVIDLWSRGFNPDLMAKAPPIVISESFQRQYCPDLFYLKVELLDSEGRVVASWNSGERINSGACQWGGEVWDRLTHTFRDYAPGVRYVRWEDGGKDREFWLGHYGVKMDNAELILLDDRHPAHWQNLLTNPSGETGNLTGWQVTESNGSGWTVTSGGPNGSNAFQTSSGWNRRMQVVDLREHGFTADSMTKSPLIRVSQSFKGEGCPDEYYMKVELLDADGQVVAVYAPGVRTTSGSCTAAGKWDDLYHSFVDYGPNVRYVRWLDGGRDVENLTGHHGVKMAQAKLIVYSDNLLVNPAAETGDLSGWQITENGGAGWAVQPTGRDGHDTKVFATSWYWDKRVQTVDLLAQGYTEALLDQAPPIHVQERFRRVYCPDEYFLKVDLLNAQGAIVTSWSSGVVPNGGDCRWGEETWEEIYHIFQDYGPGVRYVRWEDGGKDREFWYAYYGSLLDGAYLTVQDTSEAARHHPTFRLLNTTSFYVCGPGTLFPECPCGYDGRAACPPPDSCISCIYKTWWDWITGNKTCYTSLSPGCESYCHDGLENQNGICRPKPSIECCDNVTLDGIRPGQGYVARVDLRGAQSVVPSANTSCPSPAVSSVRPVGRNNVSGYTQPWVDYYPSVNLMFNANFYDVSGFDPYVNSCSRALGLTVSNGQIVTPKGQALSEDTETLVIFQPLARTGAYADIVPDPLTQFGIGKILNAVSGFRLLRNGQFVQQPFLISPSSRRPRTVVGLDRDKRKLIVVVVNTGEDTGSGASLTALADYLKSLGAVDALTLDGSGSAQMFYRGTGTTTLPSDTRPNQNIKFYRPVPVFLGFY